MDVARAPTEARERESSESDGPSDARRLLLRLGYLFLVVAVSTFVTLFFALTMAEAFGPRSADDGTVIDRISGESRSVTCNDATGCTTQTYPTFTVIGERADGSAWLVVGEGAYDAMRGEIGEPVRVSTSSVTNRVVALDGDDSWDVADSGMVWIAVGGFALWVPLLVAYEAARRTGRTSLGRFRRSELLAAVPALALGLFGVWFVMFSKAHGLEVETSQSAYGDFLVDPLGFETTQPDPPAEGDPIPVGRWTGSSTSEVVVVGVDDLVPELRGLLADEGELLAVPLIQRDSVGGRDLVTLRLVAEGEFFDDGIADVDCPETLPAFDFRSDRGFRCFEADAVAGRELRLAVGANSALRTSTTVDFDEAYVDR